MPCSPARVQGETVPYVVCVEHGADGAPVAGAAERPLADRAFHPEEVAASGGSLRIDTAYYLAHQVGTAVGWMGTAVPAVGTAHQH